MPTKRKNWEDYKRKNKLARAKREAARKEANSASLPTGSKTCPGCKIKWNFNEFHKQRCSPDGRQTRCKECTKATSLARRDDIRKTSNAWYHASRDEILAKRKSIRDADPEHARALSRKWREANLQQARLIVKAAVEKNRAKYAEKTKRWAYENREKRSLSGKKWREKNPEKARAFCAQYFASKLNATPTWADKLVVQRFYSLATVLNKRDGKGSWHVDHIVPLRSKWVCGLHNQFNLRVIPRSENCRKSNSHWPDMFDRKA